MKVCSRRISTEIEYKFKSMMCDMDEYYHLPFSKRNGINGEYRKIGCSKELTYLHRKQAFPLCKVP
jgi:hypothetical protein